MMLLRALIMILIMILIQPLMLLFVGWSMGSIVALIMPSATSNFLSALGLGTLTFAQLSGIVAFLSGFLKMGFIARETSDE